MNVPLWGVKQPRLLLCEAVGTPMMTGLFHPVLLLPHEDYEPAALRFILRHELCHLKRHDLAYKLVLTAANAVHWFDPLVYWMLRQADEDVELACDSRATEGMTHAERTTYGETLLAAVQAKIAPGADDDKLRQHGGAAQVPACECARRKEKARGCGSRRSPSRSWPLPRC